MMNPSGISLSIPPITLLTESQIKQFHCAALDLLERVGVVFQHSKAVEILQSVGCRIEKDNLVKIPPSVVEQAINMTPPSVDIYNQSGKLQMVLEKNNVYFGAGGPCPYIT